jgi:hypothetical protein
MVNEQQRVPWRSSFDRCAEERAQFLGARELSCASNGDERSAAEEATGAKTLADISDHSRCICGTTPLGAEPYTVRRAATPRIGSGEPRRERVDRLLNEEEVVTPGELDWV